MNQFGEQPVGKEPSADLEFLDVEGYDRDIATGGYLFPHDGAEEYRSARSKFGNDAYKTSAGANMFG